MSKTSRRARTETPPLAPAAEYTEALPAPVPFHTRVLRALLRFVYRNLIAVLIVVILLIAAGYYYYQYHHILAQGAGNAPSKAQIAEAVAAVEKLMYIQNDTGAQLAIVTDTSKLAGQRFFANAQDGDELVLFPASEQAVLYRPSINKIIQVGPFTPQNASAPTISEPSGIPKPDSTTSASSAR